MKKLISILLSVTILICLYPQNMTVRADEAGTDMESIVREQIEAFAKSIDQKDADNKAAKALASHGISGRGKKLSVGKNHALTATLWNSELFQQALIDGCLGIVTTMQQTDLTSLPYSYGYMVWVDNTFQYCLQTCTAPIMESKYKDWMLGTNMHYKGETNAYDSSLTWMAGRTDVLLKSERTKVTADEVTYRITVTTLDRFDFSTSGNSGFKNLISGIAAFLFKEFDWEATASFDLKIPYSCTHTSGAYHWTYDSDRKTMIFDTEDGYAENAFIQHSYLNSVGETVYYYEATETIRLSHDKPWVLEYDVKNARQIPLTPFENTVSRSIPSLIQSYYNSLFFVSGDCYRPGLNEYEVQSYYGMQLNDLCNYDNKQVYTFRLQNKLLPDGKNMIYFSIFKTDTDEVLVDQLSMDGYYCGENGKIVLGSESSGWMSGRDLYINFIGNRVYRFEADYFDLRIWENGKDVVNTDTFTEKTTKPTCTSKGYTTYTCILCGYSYKADYTAKLSHKYDGETDGDCNTCGVFRFIRGDMNGDGSINSADAVYLLRHSIMAEQYPITQSADVNGDGTVNGADAIYLLRHCIMPKEYPLA